MDTLTFDLLSSLLSNIENEAIGQLSVTSKNMGNITNELKNDTIFYKSRVENLLGYSILYTPLNFSLASIAKQNVLQAKAVDSSYGKPAKLKFSYKGSWKEFYSILIKSDPGKANWLNSALLSAARNGNYLATKVLLSDQRVDPSDDDNQAIVLASLKGHTEVVKLLLADQRVDPSDNDNKAIFVASLEGHTEVVKLLLADQRVDPSDEDNDSIQKASEHGHIEIAKLLLADQRVDPSDNNNHAIQEASINGHLEIVKLLLADRRVDPSGKNNYTILEASRNGYQGVVRLLLGSDKINLSIKAQALDMLQSSELNYDNIEKLVKKSLKELIQIGNQNLQARDIIMSKFFWWLRLEVLHNNNMYNIKEDPFKLALQL